MTARASTTSALPRPDAVVRGIPGCWSCAASFTVLATTGLGSTAPWWPVVALLASVVLAALAAGQRAAAGVPAAAPGPGPAPWAMSAAALSMNTRGVATAYAVASRGAWFACHRLGGASSCCSGVTCSRWPGLPARLAAVVLLAWLAVGLIAAASHGRSVSCCRWAARSSSVTWPPPGCARGPAGRGRPAPLGPVAVPVQVAGLAARGGAEPGRLLAAGLPVAVACSPATLRGRRPCWP